MTEDEIRAEIASQIRETLSRLASSLRETATEHGPVVAKTLILTADEVDRLF
ncbi:MAG: hypothetical protein ABI823_14335 [Bryobacteraceae bacterium]